MKFLSLIILVLTSSALIILVSCSENSTNTNVNPDNSVSEYFPMNIGNWWSHINYLLDDNGERSDFTWNDSVWVQGKVEIYGKTSFALVSSYLIQGNIKLDTNYFNLDGKKIYLYMPSRNPAKEGQWQLFFDSDAQEWVRFHIEDVFRDTLTYPISEIKDTTIFKVRTKIDEQRVISIDSKDFVIKGQTVNALGFTVIQYSSDIETYNGIVKSDFSDTTNISTFYVAKGIGIVSESKIQFSPQSHNIVHLEQVLSDYHVNL